MPRPILNESETQKAISGFTFVYQGGHHNVYCNGTVHHWTTGGYAGVIDTIEVYRTGPCDCAAYKER